MASRQISSPHSRYGPYGLFTREQCIHVISSVFRLLGVPIGPVGALAYSRDVVTPDHCTIVRYRGTRTGDELHVGAARWIIYSLTSDVMVDEPGSGEMTSIWGMVESLLQSVETAFHPSNSGQWTNKLAAFVYRMAEKFAQRWTQEQRGKRPDIPEERRLTPEVKKRFVLALRKVVFMSIYDKNGQASCMSLIENLSNFSSESEHPRYYCTFRARPHYSWSFETILPFNAGSIRSTSYDGFVGLLEYSYANYRSS